MTEPDLEELVGLDRVRDEVQRILALCWEEERRARPGSLARIKLLETATIAILDEVTIDLLLG